MSEDLTLLLVSYDGYGDMWPAFFECKERFWPDCPYPIVLANNEKQYKAKNLQVINCGLDAQWSTRTRKALESINSKYVMFLLEDLFISGKVNTQDVEGAIRLMEKEKIKYYKIMTFTKIRTKNYKGIDYLFEIPSSIPYGISLQASIWEKNYFMDLIGSEDYNPWVFEVNRLKEEQCTQDNNNIVGVFDNRNIMNICHMVVQGKYLPGSIKYMNERGVNVDVKSRGVMSCYESFVYTTKLIISSYTDNHPILRKFLRKIGPSSVVNHNTK